jgi:hypothetical protein
LIVQGNSINKITFSHTQQSIDWTLRHARKPTSAVSKKHH